MKRYIIEGSIEGVELTREQLQAVADDLLDGHCCDSLRRSYMGVTIREPGAPLEESICAGREPEL